MNTPTVSTSARTGIFGGTFNPIHIGHLRAAEEVCDALGLEQILFVPSADPPHKDGAHDDPIASAEQRLEWVRLAIRDNPRFAVEALEVERGGASYTVETLDVLCERLAPEKPVFVIGQDAFLEVDSWREPKQVFALAHFAVMTRPPVEVVSLADWMPYCIRDDMEPAQDGLSAVHRRTGSAIWLIDIPALDISSSEIRLAIREGRSVRYLLPAAVNEAIDKEGAYRWPSPPTPAAGGRNA